ncbi:unnamed protein product [Closterium sp. Naga37s-1]|nr:unnamed protein product [Closterium sp. Naga37s-1]
MHLNPALALYPAFSVRGCIAAPSRSETHDISAHSISALSPVSPFSPPLPTPHFVPLPTPHFVPLPTPHFVPLPTPHFVPLPTPHFVPLPTPHFVPLPTPHFVPLPTPHFVPLPTPHFVPLPTLALLWPSPPPPFSSSISSICPTSLRPPPFPMFLHSIPNPFNQFLPASFLFPFVSPSPVSKIPTHSIQLLQHLRSSSLALQVSATQSCHASHCTHLLASHFAFLPFNLCINSLSIPTSGPPICSPPSQPAAAP